MKQKKETIIKSYVWILYDNKKKVPIPKQVFISLGLFLRKDKREVESYTNLTSIGRNKKTVIEESGR